MPWLDDIPAAMLCKHGAGLSVLRIHSASTMARLCVVRLARLAWLWVTLALLMITVMVQPVLAESGDFRPDAITESQAESSSDGHHAASGKPHRSGLSQFWQKLRGNAPADADSSAEEDIVEVQPDESEEESERRRSNSIRSFLRGLF